MAVFTPEYLKSPEMQNIIKQVSAMYSSSATGNLVAHGLKNDLQIKRTEAQMGVTNPEFASKNTLGATKTEATNIKTVQQEQKAPTLAETQQKDHKLGNTNVFKR